MSRMIEIEIGEKTYKLGFPDRKAAIIAEDKGLDLISQGGRVLTKMNKLFYTGLLKEQPEITEEEANSLMEQYMNENGDINEVISFLTDEYLNFFKSPNSKKNKKKAKIIKI